MSVFEDIKNGLLQAITFEKDEKTSVLILNDLRKTSKMAECCWQKKQLKAWLMN